VVGHAILKVETGWIDWGVVALSFIH